jgi:hypothetical protein
LVVTVPLGTQTLLEKLVMFIMFSEFVKCGYAFIQQYENDNNKGILKHEAFLPGP